MVLIALPLSGQKSIDLKYFRELPGIIEGRRRHHREGIRFKPGWTVSDLLDAARPHRLTNITQLESHGCLMGV